MVRIVGDKKHSARLKRIAKKAPDAAWKAVKRGSLAILHTGNRLMAETSRSGRAYRRGARVHLASAPGNPPAIDTGRLVASGRTEWDEAAKIARVIWSTNYAAALEFGTSKMAERPYARPATEIERPKINENVKEAVSITIRKS